MSGYERDTALEGITLGPEDVFVEKPYDTAYLVEFVGQSARKK